MNKTNGTLEGYGFVIAVALFASGHFSLIQSVIVLQAVRFTAKGKESSCRYISANY